MADLAKKLNLNVILVVGLKLGCLNHALLTAEAIRRDGLNVIGWVGNRLTLEPMLYESENIATLKSAIGAPLLGCLPFSPELSPETVCKHLDLSCLEL